MSKLIVQKFGGTSLADLDCIEKVAERIRLRAQGGDRMVVVVSAMAGETDRLEALANRFCGEIPHREMDMLVATGEQVSASLLSMALKKKAVKSRAFLGHQIPIRTSEDLGEARIESIDPRELKEWIFSGGVAVVAGYQGVNARGEITTLGRGGSDLTAVALAGALDADLCEICTDVRGVYTADPRICSEARPIRKLCYDEMLELACLGAKVLQARSVQLAKRYQIPIYVRSSFEQHPGTTVTTEELGMEGTVVSAISCDRTEGKISIRNLSEDAEKTSSLFRALAEQDISVDVIVQDRSDSGKVNLTFTVPRLCFSKALETAQLCKEEDHSVEIKSHEKVTKVSAVGLGMRSHSGVAARIFGTLSREGIEVMAVSTSEIKICCVLDERYGELAVRALHEEFGLAKEPN